ncbi:hypothetical protein C0995_016403 [Termitomyces sp. Mi166|nr:hypothetical protein C0995_016403 [Termitomyces sp. Mi166\
MTNSTALQAGREQMDPSRTEKYLEHRQTGNIAIRVSFYSTFTRLLLILTFQPTTIRTCMDPSRTYAVEYPFNHSTYYTRNDDDPYTSELPVRNPTFLVHRVDKFLQPMDSEEDVLQEHLMVHRQYGRDNAYLNPSYRRRETQQGHLFSHTEDQEEFSESLSEDFGEAIKQQINFASAPPTSSLSINNLMSSQTPRSIVIIGGGIIGCTTAYYITHHPSYSEDIKVTVVETSAHGAAQGASGKAGGLVARWAYPQPLVNVSFDEHVRLADLHGGADRWGWRYVNCGSWEGRGEEIVKEPIPEHDGDDLEKDFLGDRQKSLQKTLGLEGGKPNAKRNPKQDTGFPFDLDWMHSELTDSYTPMAPYGDTAQVHPYLFTQSMLALAQECGASFLTNTKATSITTSPSGHVTGVECIVTHAQTSSDGDLVGEGKTRTEKTHLDATHVVVAAGAWAPRLIPALPVTGTRAHSITIHPPAQLLPIAPYVLFTEISLPASTTRSLSHTSPEIYARPGPDGEVYACGPGDDAPLPDSVDDVVTESSACDDVWEEVRSVSRVLRAGRVDRRQACFLPTILGRRQGPIIGAADTVARGLMVAVGHTCWVGIVLHLSRNRLAHALKGICNAPGTARAIAEHIMDDEIRCADLKALRPELFL